MTPLPALPRQTPQSSTHIATITATVTPMPSPVKSPACLAGVVARTSAAAALQLASQKCKRNSNQSSKWEKEKRPKSHNHRQIRHHPPRKYECKSDKKKELTEEKVLKFVYTNVTSHPDVVKKNLNAGKYELTRVRKEYLAHEFYHQIKLGGAYKPESLEKLENNKEIEFCNR